VKQGGLVASRRIATSFAAAAAILWGRVLVGPEAPHSASLRTTVPRRIGSMGAPAIVDTTADDLIERAIERDPFGVRRAAAELPSPAAEPAANTEPALRVIGTVVDSLGGSFAFCQLGSAQPRILRVGQKIGTYELRAVEQGRATFAGPDGIRLERQVPRAGA